MSRRERSAKPSKVKSRNSSFFLQVFCGDLRSKWTCFSFKWRICPIKKNPFNLRNLCAMSVKHRFQMLNFCTSTFQFCMKVRVCERILVQSFSSPWRSKNGKIHSLLCQYLFNIVFSQAKTLIFWYKIPVLWQDLLRIK